MAFLLRWQIEGGNGISLIWAGVSIPGGITRKILRRVFLENLWM